MAGSRTWLHLDWGVPPDEGWVERAPTAFRVLQWSAEGTAFKGWISLPMAAGEPGRVESRGPGSHLHLRNMTARTARVLCTGMLKPTHVGSWVLLLRKYKL